MKYDLNKSYKSCPKYSRIKLRSLGESLGYTVVEHADYIELRNIISNKKTGHEVALKIDFNLDYIPIAQYLVSSYVDVLGLNLISELSDVELIACAVAKVNKDASYIISLLSDDEE